ncbi:MAG TPA: glycosyltransferase [Thermoleophilaceae bacterium]|nr:glycosyltransferase [Thermoleophilaceae bacterium]
MTAALQRTEVGARPLDELGPACGAEALERIEAAASRVRGQRVLHVSAAGDGGGVPELLGALLPLAASTGLEVEWRVLFGDLGLRELSAALHTGMQGAESAITDASWERYLDACGAAAGALDGGSYDAVFLHDPATLGLVQALGSQRVLWRCHVDASRPDGPAWERLFPLAEGCEAVILPARSFAPPGPKDQPVPAIAPGIDPVGPRNAELSPHMAGRLLRRLGADLDRPICSQLMRLDRWKDPHKALEAFAIAREELAGLQFVIACELEGSGDGWAAVKEISDYAAGQDGLHLLTSYAGNLGDLELDALNQLSRVAIRLSLREGFGLASSEALWRNTPVVGNRDGGTPLQVRDGIDGYLADDAAETAERIVELVRDPGLAIEMGRAGHERVRERFLITRVLEDELTLLASLS